MNRVTTARGGTFYISDKYDGFEAVEYRVDNGQWRSAGTKNAQGYYNNGRGVYYNYKLEIRFNRQTYDISFLDGKYVDENNVETQPSTGAVLNTVPDVMYGANVSSYNEGGANYYVPTAPDGYVFDGWYTDDACTKPYTFTTMPKNNVTVYAKWRQIQYRVFLHPNAGTDTTLDWGSDAVGMNFLIDYDGTVSLPTGLRSEYEFVGWYSDAACTKAYNAKTKLNSTTVTEAYDKSTDMTDVMDKWGNGATYNVDVDSPWITNKLDLYAKWRAKLIGADGIGIVYDANGGSIGTESSVEQEYEMNGTIGFPVDPVREGYEFLGWSPTKYTDDQTPDLTTKIDTSKTWAADALDGLAWDDGTGTNVLYAMWKKQYADVTVHKTVTGVQADMTKEFKFTATATDASGNTVDLGDQAGFTLGDGDEAVIEKVPVGSKLTIVEENGSYTASYEVTTGDTPTQGEGNTAVIDKVEKNTDVYFTNNKEDVVPTGVAATTKTPLLPLLVAGLLVAVGAVAITRRRDIGGSGFFDDLRWKRSHSPRHAR